MKGDNAMYSKEDFLNALTQETQICNHLHSKMNEDMLQYSPGDEIRNTHELMKYLTYCVSGPVDAILSGGWDKVGKYQEEAKSLTLAEFPARMDAQLEFAKSQVAGLSDADFGREVDLPWGVTAKLGTALVDTALRFLTAYRLQFFNRIKSCGRPELNTFNSWLGMDPPAK